MQTCDGCGAPHERKSRWCGDTCKKRAQRSGLVDAPAVDDAPEPDRVAGVVAATQRELDAAQRADSALGQAALRLAALIDRGRDTGSGMASLTREWRSTLEAATRGAGAKSAVDNRRDELAARRARSA